MTEDPTLDLPELPIPERAPPRGPLGRWLRGGGRLDEPHGAHREHPWYAVLWLTGVDYFSTLGYQPGIALAAAGALAPVATSLLVLVTLLGALPVYMQVAQRSYAGQGSIAMLENLLPGWRSKIFVLVLLGFAATDFVITMTISAADAAQHAIENPFLHNTLGDARMSITLAFLASLGCVFMLGLTEAIAVAAMVAIPYLALNVVVILRALVAIALHPELIHSWSLDLAARGDWTMVLILAGLTFPKLALGLSGFETGVSVMPLVAGGPGDGAETTPRGRIFATRKLLAAAAVIMSVLLLSSSFVTTLLIPAKAVAPGGPASGRALAYLAHDLLGHGFGTVYDLSTIAVLWFAGASAMAGLLNLIPRYLPRFGMAPRWVLYRRPLVAVLFVAGAVVTWYFAAEVEPQGGAYATGVLVLMLSAAVAVALALGKEAWAAPAPLRGLALSGVFWVITGVFLFTLVDNVIVRPDGLLIGSVFIFAIVALSALSRYRRATELRVEKMTFLDAASRDLWPEVCGKRVHLVPLKFSSDADRERKRDEIRRYYRVEGSFAFVHVRFADNRSEFVAPLRLEIRRAGADFVLDVHGAVAVANSLAYVSEQMKPISLFLGLTRRNLMAQAFDYIVWGEGEVGMLVYSILVRYWEWTPHQDTRPLIFLMSE